MARKKIEDLIVIVGRIPQSDTFLRDGPVSERSPRMLETQIWFSLLPGRIQTEIRSLLRELAGVR